MKSAALLSLITLAWVFLAGTSQAVGFSLETAQVSYKPADTILVTAELNNYLDFGIDVTVKSTMTTQNKSSSDLLISSEITLGPREQKKIDLYRINVTEDFPADQYRVEARLISDGVVEEEQEIDFRVEDTLKEMVLGVHLCKDKECEYESTVFTQGDDIYLEYDSPIDNLELAGTISYPNGSRLNITLPSMFSAAWDGPYVLWSTASTLGYKNKTIKVNFAVLKQEPEIITRNLSTGATFDVTDLQISPSQVAVQELVNVSARVTNTGSAEGSYNLMLKKNGTVEATREVTLKPGMNALASFNCTAESIGYKQVELDGLIGGFNVVGEPANGFKVLHDLEFGRYTLNGVEHPLLLDLYLPELKSAHPPPLLIYIHGGGWIEGSKDDCPGAAFARSGYAVACVDYRLAACCEGECKARLTFPAQIQDIKAAVRWLRGYADKYGFDPERFGAIGDSCGGHLVALLGTSHKAANLEGDQNPDISDAVQAVCDWYGPVDVTKAPPGILFEDYPCQVDLEHLTARYGEEETPYLYWTLAWATFLGGSLTDPDVNAKALQATPLAYIDPTDPPFLVIHGENDSIVPIAQSEMLVTALERAGVDVKFIRLPGVGHSFAGPIGSYQEVDSRFFEPSLEFFNLHLKYSQEPKDLR
ncbi:MAG TPA: alpha/beta hydrolase [Methanothrix sp.]|nr:alpha/beta hydrolase [Methanothrix sp.]